MNQNHFFQPTPTQPEKICQNIELINAGIKVKTNKNVGKIVDTISYHVSTVICKKKSKHFLNCLSGLGLLINIYKKSLHLKVRCAS